MQAPEILSLLSDLNKDVYNNYSKIQEIAKALVGKELVLRRGANQKVYCIVKEWVPYSLRIKILNFDTNRLYDLDLTRVEVLSIEG
jgi:hypothetical protein